MELLIRRSLARAVRGETVYCREPSQGGFIERAARTMLLFAIAASAQQSAITSATCRITGTAQYQCTVRVSPPMAQPGTVNLYPPADISPTPLASMPIRAGTDGVQIAGRGSPVTAQLDSGVHVMIRWQTEPGR